MSAPEPSLSRESVERLREWEGRERVFVPLDRRATAPAIAKFMLAVGDDNPCWWVASPRVPPTFLYTGVHYNGWPDFTGMPRVTGQAVTTLWGGCEWRWLEPLRLDETFQVRDVIEEVAEIGGADRTRVRIRERITYTGSDGRALADHVRTTFVRARVPKEAPGRQLRHTYSAEEIAEIDACYRGELERRRGPDTRRAGEVRVGDKIGPMVKGPLTIGALVSFAMAWGAPLLPTNRMQWLWLAQHRDAALLRKDTNTLDLADNMHWDVEAWEALGFTSGFDFAPLRVCWMAHLLSDWAGDDANVERLEVRLLGQNQIGDLTWLSGEVTELIDAGQAGVRAVCILSGRNRSGEANTAGRAEVLLPR